jgi:hypothetical protein
MSEQMKLLTEWTPLNYDKSLLKEQKDQYGKMMLKGIIQRANTLNQNGRVYPTSILQREIQNYQKLIQESRALGECDHPESSVVELKNVSHIVREARMQGDDVYGTIEILDTPSGKIIQSLIESGVTLGISSRGVGSTSEPSTPGAYMLREGKDVDQKEIDRCFNKTDRIDRIFNDILRW